MVSRLVHYLLLIAVAAWLGGCAEFGFRSGQDDDVMSQTLPPKPREPRRRSETVPPPPPPKPPVREEKVDAVVTAPPAVQSLLSKAVAQHRDGNNAAAATTVERAIRIAPRYPDSYYLLAQIKLEQGQTGQARSLARKALALGADGELKNQAEDLIELCNRLES